ncbi:MAG TPA: hypothetical protein VK533_09810 [Sphingomonas sp.]|uniref:hypothetical protein n=1 Tax=Sphingomonas sp. TaxID=28214 RepID=UPI002C67CEF2|nr:hypothetical protein [Sphingomonas sp.]HMI19829.1 hypothetical protein [Sphingomonas sp.]
MEAEAKVDQPCPMVTIFRSAGVWIALAATTAAAPANAHPATVHVISCDAGSCVLVRGHRSTSEAVIRINDRVVEAEGGRSWQVRLPVATVQDWSAPFARTLRVSIADAARSTERTEAVRLPVGLLGHNLELASLVVRPR